MYIREPDLPARLAGALPAALPLPAQQVVLRRALRLGCSCEPAKRLGYGLWQAVDVGVIDRFGPDGVAAAALTVARRAVRLQTGYLYHYAFAMLIGVAALVTWYLFAAVRRQR